MPIEPENPDVIDYANPQHSYAKRKRRIWLYIAIPLLLLVPLIAILLPSMNDSHDHPPHIKCASNLRQIGLAMMMYAIEYRGQYPRGFEILLRTQDMTSEVFACPSDNAARAPLPAATQPAFSFTPGVDLSYVYFGSGHGSSDPPNTVLACDNPNNHINDGMKNPIVNVLFNDGVVYALSTKEFAKLLSELSLGHNPPRAEKFQRPP